MLMRQDNEKEVHDPSELPGKRRDSQNRSVLSAVSLSLLFWGFMWEGERNTSGGGGVCVCGGALTPTLTALISHLTTCSNGQTIIISEGWGNHPHPSPGAMIYREHKTSHKSAGDKLSGKRTFFPLYCQGSEDSTWSCAA